MKRFFIVWVCFFTSLLGFSQKFDVDTLIYNGDPDKFINIVIVPDGFTQQEFGWLDTVANSIEKIVFSHEPYVSYRNYFNLFLIKVPSNQSGINHPGNAPDEGYPNEIVPKITVDNYFKSSLDRYRVHRSVGPGSFNSLVSVLADNVPQYDLVIFPINTKYYGGSGGGGFAYYTLDYYSSPTLIHELGHGLGKLADEYWPERGGREAHNMTQNNNPQSVKWKDWLNEPKIGIHKHCCGSGSNLYYKPSNKNCVMESHSPSSYCLVCREGVIEQIHSIFNPLVYTSEPINTVFNIDTVSKFKIKTNIVQPISPTIRRIWRLDNEIIAYNVDSIEIDFTKIPVEKLYYTLSLSYLDTTSQIKNQNHFLGHTETVSWHFRQSCKKYNALGFSDTLVCEDEIIKISNKYPNGQYWSTSDTNTTIYIKADNDKVIWSAINDIGIHCIDSVRVKVIKNKNSLVEDTIVCEKTYARITDKSLNDSTYNRIWSNGDTGLTTSIFIDTTMKVWLNIKKSNTSCADSANFRVYQNKIKTSVISGKTVLKPNEKKIYSVISTKNKFHWSVVNASITSATHFNSVEIQAPVDTGKIYLKVVESDYYCADSASMEIDVQKPIPIGINEVNSTFSIYPNPTSGTLLIDFAKNVAEELVSVEVFSIEGKNVLTINDIYKDSVEINLSHLPNGIYHLKINSTKNSYNKKISVER